LFKTINNGRKQLTYIRVYPSIGDRILSQAGSSVSSCRCDDGGSSDSVRSLINVCNHKHTQATDWCYFRLDQTSTQNLRE